jgi:hypothetical protein
MSKAAGVLAMSSVLGSLACGGSTSLPVDAWDARDDGSADAATMLDGGAHDRADLVAVDVLANWQKVTVDNGFGPCPQKSCASSWVVSSDGQIAKIREGDAGVGQMTPSDMIDLDAIVSSRPFLDGMTNGFVCDQPPTDVFVSLRLERDGASQMQAVTGCVFSGPSGNLPRRVNELVTKY